MPRNKIKRITRGLLRRHQACHDAMEEFNEAFPNGAAINVRNATKAFKLDLNVGWLAKEFMSDGQCDLYNELIDELNDWWHQEKRKLVSADSCMVKVLINGVEPLWYEKRMTALRAEYDRRDARAFIAAWNGTLKRRKKR